jgi:hypothetical protein
MRCFISRLFYAVVKVLLNSQLQALAWPWESSVLSSSKLYTGYFQWRKQIEIYQSVNSIKKTIKLR